MLISGLGIGLDLVGTVLALTGLFGFCALYSLLGNQYPQKRISASPQHRQYECTSIHPCNQWRTPSIMENAIPYESPSLSRRQLLNFLTGATVAATVGGALYPAAKFLVPPREVIEGGGILAKDKLGNPIPASQILANPPGTRALIAGLAGEPTYLTVKDDSVSEQYGHCQQLHPPGVYLPLESPGSAISMSLSWVSPMIRRVTSFEAQRRCRSRLFM